jgi:hypothetical protein
MIDFNGVTFSNNGGGDVTIFGNESPLLKQKFSSGILTVNDE